MAVYGLVIGVSKYPDYPGGSPLTWALADADAFYNWLLTKGGASEATLRRLLSEDSERHPDQKDVDKALRSLIYDAAENRSDRADGHSFFFYFSGHGCAQESGADAIELADFDPEFSGLSLSVDHYLSCLQLAPFRRVFFFLDVCRNVQDIAAPGGPRFNCHQWATDLGSGRYDTVHEACVAFFATSPTQFAGSPQSGGGFFTSALIEALNGSDGAWTMDNDRALVTVGTLHNYVTNRVRRLVDQQKIQFIQEPDRLPRDKYTSVVVASIPLNLAKGSRVRITFRDTNVPLPGLVIRIEDNLGRPVMTKPAETGTIEVFLPTNLYFARAEYGGEKWTAVFAAPGMVAEHEWKVEP